MGIHHQRCTTQPEAAVIFAWSSWQQNNCMFIALSALLAVFATCAAVMPNTCAAVMPNACAAVTPNACAAVTQKAAGQMHVNSNSAVFIVGLAMLCRRQQQKKSNGRNVQTSASRIAWSEKLASSASNRYLLACVQSMTSVQDSQAKPADSCLSICLTASSLVRQDLGKPSSPCKFANRFQRGSGFGHQP